MVSNKGPTSSFNIFFFHFYEGKADGWGVGVGERSRVNIKEAKIKTFSITNNNRISEIQQKCHAYENRLSN